MIVQHRLISTGGATPCQYFYNDAGNRLKAIQDGVITRYIYDASGNLLAEADEQNKITRYYIYGLGLLAMVTPSDSDSDKVYCYHYNATGSTIAMTDASQQIVNKYSYSPFGIITNQQKAVPQPFKYVGQYGVMTEPNGLQYMRARYYDPQVGRFISEDPIGFAGGDVNLFVYCLNNPILLIDPFGLSGRSIALGIASTTTNTAALALIWNPPAALATKVVGAAFSTAAIVNAGYEYTTGQMSGSEAAINIVAAAMDVVGPAIGSKIAGVLLTGSSRAVCIASTSVGIAQSLGPSSAAAAEAMPSSPQNSQFQGGTGK